MSAVFANPAPEFRFVAPDVVAFRARRSIVVGGLLQALAYREDGAALAEGVFVGVESAQGEVLRSAGFAARTCTTSAG